MPTHSISDRRISVRTRGLSYALLAFVALMVMLGPVIAEAGLGALGCRSGLGSASANCGGLAGVAATRLAPWISAIPPIDTTFMLLQQSWGLLAIWIVSIVLSIRFDQRVANVQAPVPDPRAGAEVGVVATSTQRPGNPQAEWVRLRTLEQAAEAKAEQQSLTRRLMAEGLFWAAIAWLMWSLLIGLIVFCFMFGMPLLGGISAENLLGTLGCSHAAELSQGAWIGSCGFWTERLEPYRQPFFGALLSPVWLFTQFSDLLLAWLGVIVALASLPIYRFSWSALVGSSLPGAVKVLVAVLGLCVLALVLGQFFDLSGWASPPATREYGLEGGVIRMLEIAAVVLLSAAAAVVLLIALVIGVATRSGTGKKRSAAAPRKWEP